jgi:hypothetical protein
LRDLLQAARDFLLQRPSAAALQKAMYGLHSRCRGQGSSGVGIE